jgi:hypothetical protein
MKTSKTDDRNVGALLALTLAAAALRNSETPGGRRWRAPSTAGSGGAAPTGRGRQQRHRGIGHRCAGGGSGPAAVPGTRADGGSRSPTRAVADRARRRRRARRLSGTKPNLATWRCASSWTPLAGSTAATAGTDKIRSGTSPS